MPLNLSVSDGDFVPYIKYNAKAGRWYVKPENANEEIEIMNPALAFDMANIKTGWLFYSEGSGPEKVWDPSPSQMASKPPGPRKFKRGFEVMVYSNFEVDGKKLGLREFSSTAASVITPMLRMYSEYEAGAAANSGKVPVFVCSGVKPINGAYGVNYEPQFSLRAWVPRSRIPDFDKHETKPPSAQADDFGIPSTPQVAPRTQQQSMSVKQAAPMDMDDTIPFAPEFR